MKTRTHLVLMFSLTLTLIGATLTMATQAGAGRNVSPPRPKGPCDIYAVAGAPCLLQRPALPGPAPVLQDEASFAKATMIAGEGWAVVWPEHDIQIGADTLWLDGQAQNAPDENSRIFLQWRARNGLSLAAAAKALGMTTRTVSAYGTGARPVPRYIALACKGWEAQHGRCA